MAAAVSEAGRVVLQTAAAYAFLVVLLRFTGNRTLSKLRAFDLVVTIALGSLLASTAVSRSVGLLEGFAAILTLVGLQAFVAWSAVRSARVNELVTNPPRILWYRGRYLDDAMRKVRVTREEVELAMRDRGLADASSALAVVLEPNGDLTAIPQGDGAAQGLVRAASRERRDPPLAGGRSNDEPLH